jgi:hypothetical protein
MTMKNEIEAKRSRAKARYESAAQALSEIGELAG